MKDIPFGPVTFYPFGAVVAAAAALALIWFAVSCKGKLKAGTASWFAVLALPLSFVFARLGRALVSSGLYLFKQDFLFNFARGGYLLYGALIGCLLAAWLTARLTKQSTAVICDAAAAPAAFVIAVSRLMEGFMGAGYGRGIEEWFDPFMEQTFFPWEDPSPLYRFPIGVQDMYGEWHFSIFLLETIAALVIMIAVLRIKKANDGGRCCWMLLLYASLQALFETMRADSIPRWGFVKVSQLFSAIMVAAVLLLCCVKAAKRISRGKMALAWCLTLLCVGLILLMEFAMEQKVPFLRWMRMDLCFAVMAVGSLGMILSVRPVWIAAYAANDRTGGKKCSSVLC